MSRPDRARRIVLAVLLTVLSFLVAAPTHGNTVPAAPTLMTSGGSLVWTDNSLNETGFAIERCYDTGCTGFGQIAIVAANSTSYTDDFRRAGVNRYRIRAVSTAGASSYSNIVELVLLGTDDVFAAISATPTAGTAPLTVTLDGSGSSGPNGPIASWQWSFGDNQTASGALVSHTYTTPGVYAATLRVVGGGAFPGASSAAVLITVSPTPPPPVLAASDLSANTSLRGRIRLAWTNPTSSASTLAVERCRGERCTSFSRVASFALTTTSYVDRAVKRGTVYRYRLAASDAAETAYSNIVTARAR